MKNKKYKFFYALSLAWQLGFLIVLPIILLFLLGIFLDKTFKTSPLFLFLGIFLGIAFSSYSVYHSFLPLLKERKKL